MILKNISKTFIVCSTLFLLIPYVSFGYYTTNQYAKRITNNTALYTITYTFGLQHKDLYMPITVSRGLSFGDSKDIFSLGYSVTPSEHGSSLYGHTTGLVLSSAPIVDGMYKVKAGTAATFTLVIVLTVDDNDPMAKYALQVDKLPFIAESPNGKKELRELNNFELQKYVTPSIGLNR